MINNKTGESLEDMRLICNRCGYEQDDKETIVSVMSEPINEDDESRDVMYLCGACMDADDVIVSDKGEIEEL